MAFIDYPKTLDAYTLFICQRAVCSLSLQLYKKLSFVTCQSQNGGGERARTDDLLRAKQVLSQLSYTPKNEFRILEFGLSL